MKTIYFAFLILLLVAPVLLTMTTTASASSSLPELSDQLDQLFKTPETESQKEENKTTSASTSILTTEEDQQTKDHWKSIEDKSSIINTKYLSIDSHSFFGDEISGGIKNIGTDDIEVVAVTAVLFDTSGHVIDLDTGTLNSLGFGTVSDRGLNAGEAGFYKISLGNLAIPSLYKLDDLDHYVLYPQVMSIVSTSSK
jgi:hypothetical protein